VRKLAELMSLQQYLLPHSPVEWRTGSFDLQTVARQHKLYAIRLFQIPACLYSMAYTHIDLLYGNLNISTQVHESAMHVYASC
jgi:hypothetical protein